jgi:hypothetical protein
MEKNEAESVMEKNLARIRDGKNRARIQAAASWQGHINLGLLYPGKYVPPERVGDLLPVQEQEKAPVIPDIILENLVIVSDFWVTNT